MEQLKHNMESTRQDPIYIPKKIKDDSIIEAICEIRFVCDEDEVEEIVIGRLSDNPKWKSYKKVRLSVADIPASMRLQDPDLKFKPILSLQNAESGRTINIGSNVVSYHVTGEYCGWDLFYVELQAAIKHIFDHLSNISIERLGFRYVNAMTSKRHYIDSFNSLNLDIKVAGSGLNDPINLNFGEAPDDSHLVMTKIASKEFTTGNLPVATSVIVDVDVFTPQKTSINKYENAIQWIDDAHGYEKNAFFCLIPIDTIKKLEEGA